PQIPQALPLARDVGVAVDEQLCDRLGRQEVDLDLRPREEPRERLRPLARREQPRLGAVLLELGREGLRERAVPRLDLGPVAAGGVDLTRHLAGDRRRATLAVDDDRLALQ